MTARQIERQCSSGCVSGCVAWCVCERERERDRERENICIYSDLCTKNEHTYVYASFVCIYTYRLMKMYILYTYRETESVCVRGLM